MLGLRRGATIFFLLFWLSPYSSQQHACTLFPALGVSSAEVLMCEILVAVMNGIVMCALLMEAIHVKLNGREVTWRTNEVYFWCLKYCGRI